MKKNITSILIVTLIISLFSCANTPNLNHTNNDTNTKTNITNQTQENNKVSINTTNQTQNKDNKKSELVTKIENFFNKEVVKKVLDGKSVSQIVDETVKKMPDEEIKNIEQQYPELSFSKSNFENDEKTYNWLSIALKVLIKDSIERGYLTQKQIDEYKTYLTLIGINLSNIEIKKGMTDIEIENLCIALLDILDRIANPTILKLIGIDVNDPNLLENLLNGIS